MTTKRKQILKAIAVSGSATMDDLVMTTGLERKNLHDNVKAALKGELCQRIKDDVTGQPAYKLTTKGRAWLENDKDDTASSKATISKPQPAVGKNSGSKDAGSIVDGGKVGADSLPVGNAVSAPPKPDKMPVAACADDIDIPVVKDSLTTEMPTDKECCNAAKVVATTAGTHVAELRAQLKLAEQQRDEHYHQAELLQLELAGIKETVAQQRSTIDAKDTEIGINDAAVDGWLDLAMEFECKSIPELRVFINAAVDKLDRLRSVKAENSAMTILNESMPGFGAVHKALSGRAYLVRIPKKAPRVFSKRSNAEAAAMSAAKQRGTVNVFALVPVGKAIRGSEWRDA